MSETEYASDVSLMIGAFGTDSRAQQDRLVKASEATPWVRAVDGSGNRGLWATPGDVYLSTESLRRLFDGVGDVLLVDPDVFCLTGRDARRLLRRSGATRYLKPVAAKCDLSRDELRIIRRGSGLERRTWEEIEDRTIRGLDALFNQLTALDPAERPDRARGLWNALADLNKRRGSGQFEAAYRFSYHHERKVASFDAAFVRKLNERPWIPDSSGNLHRPSSVAFGETGWEPDSFLESRIRFKPPLLEHLAREAGIEPGVLDLLKQMGVTTEAELRKHLGVQSQDPTKPEHTRGRDGQVSEGANPEPSGPGGGHGEESTGDDSEPIDPDGRKAPHSVTPRQFESYVGVVSEDGEKDPDGIEHSARMDLERSAIRRILDVEPELKWQETPPNNPRFDLYRGATMDTATEWCEVKAMKRTLDDRPVGISRTQFEWAEKHRDKYWLYVVERAGESDPNIVRIQDPVGKAKTFTFDRGWRAVAR